jgi:hypothetical protein
LWGLFFLTLLVDGFTGYPGTINTVHKDIRNHEIIFRTFEETFSANGAHNAKKQRVILSNMDGSKATPTNISQMLQKSLLHWL